MTKYLIAPTLALLLPGLATAAIQGRSDYPLGKGGGGPVCVAVADFDGNGWPDAATANSTSGNVTVLLGSPGGTLSEAPGSPIPSFVDPTVVRASDMNGDGRPDLIVLDGGRGEVAVLLGNGAGGFAPAPRSPHFVGRVADRLFVGDFNGDGHVDVAAGGYDQTDLLLGTSGGDLVRSPYAPIAAGSLIAAGDLDLDGLCDLVVLPYNGGMPRVFRGRSDGSLLEVHSDGVPTVDVAAVACIADVNGDGFPDLVAYAYYSMQVLFGTGNGALIPGIAPFPLDDPVWSLAVADFDADGKPDVVATGGALQFVWGIGSASRSLSAYLGGAYDLAVVDLDRDDKLDIVLSYGSANAVGWIRGLGGRSIAGQPSVRLGSFPSEATRHADLDHDGVPELVILGATGSRKGLHVLRRAPGGYAEAAGSPYTFDGAVRAFTMTDVDGNGDLDIVASVGDVPSPNRLDVLFGDGTGLFTRATGPGTTVPYGVVSISAGRIDGDAFVDVVTNAGTLLLGNGLGGFVETPDVTLFTGTKTLVDLDGDGDLDALGIGLVSFGDGAGHFGPPVQAPGAESVTRWTTGDLDGDGIPDVVAVGKASIVVFGGDGAGGFVPLQTIAIPHQHAETRATLGDLNQDGRLDLAVASTFVLDTYLANADGTLTPGPSYPLSGIASSLAIGDLDGDGTPDILAVSGTASRVSIFSSAPAPVFTPDALLPARTGLAYRSSVAATGGTPPYSFSTRSLPFPLALSADGRVRGRATPYRSTTSVILSVTDATGRTGFRSVAFPVEPARLFTLTPCRLVDTREDGIPVPAVGRRRFAASRCGLPEGATLLAANVTVTGSSAPGHFTLFPSDIPRPAVSTLNFGAGQTRANNALLMIDSDGFFTVENAAPADAHLIVDVSGAFD